MVSSGIKCLVMPWEGDNPKENWRQFKQHVELMFTGPLKSKIKGEKCSYLLICVGRKGRVIYNKWSDISDYDQKKLETYYECFESHVIPKANPVFARFKFHSQIQDRQFRNTRQFKNAREIPHGIPNFSPRLQFQRPRQNESSPWIKL